MTVAQWSTTAGLNVLSSGTSGTGGTNIDENCAPSGINNAIRDVMAQIATFLTGANFTLTSTDAGATAGPVLNLYRNSASPAASDIIGEINFQGEDSVGNTEEYAKINAVIDDPTSTSEDATIQLQAKVAGAMTTILSASASGVGGSAVADQTAMEAATATGLIVTPGRLGLHPAAAKAWVRWTTITTTAIAASHNVASLTDNGTGDTTITFTTAFSSANYGFALGMGNTSGPALLIVSTAAAPTASAFRALSLTLAPAAADVAVNGAVFFGDQ